MIEISIVIPTYRRPDCLPRAIRSCLAQQGVDAPCEIIVVDNNPDSSAKAAVAAIAAGGPVPIRYIAEPRPGISHARNTAIAAASGRYLAFLDDDQEAEPGWLAAHLAAIRRFDADVVFGPFQPRFPVPAEEVSPLAHAKFTRDEKMPTGSRMPARSPILGLPGISNTMIDRSRCIAGPEPFDPDFGFAGGEDTLFFRELMRRGRKMIWCSEALVSETIPADRLAVRYLLRRCFKNGQVSALTWGAMKPPARGMMGLVMFAGLVQMALFAVPAAACRACGHPRWLSFAAQVASGLGKMFCHPRMLLPIYRALPPSDGVPGSLRPAPRSRREAVE
jgi:glycosyltransferase involved in cell wall biosynthesis